MLCAVAMACGALPLQAIKKIEKSAGAGDVMDVCEAEEGSLDPAGCDARVLYRMS